MFLDGGQGPTQGSAAAYGVIEQANGGIGELYFTGGKGQVPGVVDRHQDFGQGDAGRDGTAERVGYGVVGRVIKSLTEIGLGVEIDEQGAQAVSGQERTKIVGAGRFGGAAFVIADGDSFHGVVSLVGMPPGLTEGGQIQFPAQKHS